jgi:hypothetical protein
MFDELLAGVRQNRSGVLVVRGEAGMGKTALLDYVVESAADLRVVRAGGVESEMELAFAAMHQLFAPLLDRLDRLPDPQRDALETVFGLNVGPPPDRVLVGLAVLTLVSDVAEDRPLVCVVDDAQWLDRASAQTLAFVARRLLAESVALVFATREPGQEFHGLPEVELRGLRNSDARELLGSVVRWPLDERVRDQIVAETRGNPLALLELPQGLSPAQLAGGFGLPSALPLSSRIEDSFRRRVDEVPQQTQQLLLLAAADPSGDPALLWRAAAQFGLGHDALLPAELVGLLEVGARLRFRHPLVRSAVYRAASPTARRQAHAALAQATDPDVDPDRRAWHRAQATLSPDEDVAAELEQSAGRAQGRGGLAAAAAFLERAAALTVDPARRAERLLAAVRINLRTARSTPRSVSWPRPKMDLSTSCSAPGQSCCAVRSRLSQVWAATLLRSCSTPPVASNRSTPDSRARRISTRGGQRCSPDTSRSPATCWRSREPPALLRRRLTRGAQSTCCSMASRHSSPTVGPQPRRCCGGQ